MLNSLKDTVMGIIVTTSFVVCVCVCVCVCVSIE